MNFYRLKTVLLSSFFLMNGCGGSDSKVETPISDKDIMGSCTYNAAYIHNPLKENEPDFEEFRANTCREEVSKNSCSLSLKGYFEQEGKCDSEVFCLYEGVNYFLTDPEKIELFNSWCSSYKL